MRLLTGLVMMILSSASNAGEWFARNAEVFPDQSRKDNYAYVSLFNPPSSGYHARNIRMWVSGCPHVRTGGVGALVATGTIEDQNRPPMMRGASFSESRGLSIRPGQANLARLHVRKNACGEPEFPLQPSADSCWIGGQDKQPRWQYSIGQHLALNLDPAVSTLVEVRNEITPNTHFVVACNISKTRLLVSFEWEEVPVQ